MAAITSETTTIKIDVTGSALPGQINTTPSSRGRAVSEPPLSTFEIDPSKIWTTSHKNTISSHKNPFHTRHVSFTIRRLTPMQESHTTVSGQITIQHHEPHSTAQSASQAPQHTNNAQESTPCCSKSHCVVL